MIHMVWFIWKQRHKLSNFFQFFTNFSIYGQRKWLLIWTVAIGKWKYDMIYVATSLLLLILPFCSEINQIWTFARKNCLLNIKKKAHFWPFSSCKSLNLTLISVTNAPNDQNFLKGSLLAYQNAKYTNV